MLKMNYWTDKWDLHEDVCPCDVHFNDWVAKQRLTNKSIYHFGSGTHHVAAVQNSSVNPTRNGRSPSSSGHDDATRISRAPASVVIATAPMLIQ